MTLVIMVGSQHLDWMKGFQIAATGEQAAKSNTEFKALITNVEIMLNQRKRLRHTVRTIIRKTSRATEILPTAMAMMANG